MRNIAILTVAVACAIGTGAAQAATPTFTTLDNPADPTFNQLLGINNTGMIVGYFGNASAGHPNKGYTINAPYTKFVAADLPGSVQTQMTGLNSAGVVSGFWSPTNVGDGTDENFGFIRLPDHGKFTYLSVNDPNLAGAPAISQVLGINKTDIAVGFYSDAAGNTHSFAYNAIAGSFKEIKPGGASSAATGINDSNLVSGFFTDGKGNMHGYLKPLAGGATISFSVPKSGTTQLLGVNNTGVAVGFYVGADTFPHGVVYHPSTGEWQQIDDPAGVQGTVLNGLNDKGKAVGFYTDAAGNTHGMIVSGIK